MKKKELKELIYSRAILPSTTSVEECVEFLRKHQLQYVPVVHEQKIHSLVCLNRLQKSLATPYGWSLLAKKSIYSMDFAKPLVFSLDHSWIEMVKRVVSRPLEQAYDDLVIVHEKKYLGMVSVRGLMIGQVRDYEKQIDKIHQQKELLKKTIATYLVDHSKSDDFDEKMRQVLKTAQKLESLELRKGLDEQDQVKLQGQMDQFSCADLVQLIFQGHKTGRLEIVAHDLQATFSIFFDHGLISHAEGALEMGKTAFFAALHCKIGDFVFYYDQHYPLRTIEEDPMYLLIEGCRLLDEAKQAEAWQ